MGKDEKSTTSTSSATSTVAPPSTGACACAAGWTPSFVTNSCYKLVEESAGLTWEAAQARCQADESSHLASVTSAAEDAIVYGLLKSVTQNGWIGASDKDTEGTFVWTDGSAFSFTNWNTGQPDSSTADGQDCVRMRQTDGKWDDIKCDGTGTKAFVCSKK